MKIEITYKVNEDATFDVLFNDVKIGIIEKTNSWYFRCNKKLNVDKYFLSVIGYLGDDLSKAKENLKRQIIDIIDFYNTLNINKQD